MVSDFGSWGLGHPRMADGGGLGTGSPTEKRFVVGAHATGTDAFPRHGVINMTGSGQAARADTFWVGAIGLAFCGRRRIVCHLGER